MSDFIKNIVKLAKEYRASAAKTEQQYKQQFQHKFGDKCEFLRIDRSQDGKRKIIIYKCKNHPDKQLSMRGDWLQKSQTGCSQCKKLEYRRKKQQQFIKKAEQLHKNADGTPMYSYDKVQYIDAHTKVIITCPKHGDFNQSPNLHNRTDRTRQHGEYCPRCQAQLTQFGQGFR